MSKRARPRTAKRRLTGPRPRRQVTRYEFAEVLLRLAQFEALAVRNRTDLDIQFTRIAQLQDQIDTLTKLQGATTVSPLSIQAKATVES